MSQDNNYWQDKRVVVTGGCGMVGRHLVPLLVGAGADVTVATYPFVTGPRVGGVGYSVVDVGDEETIYDFLDTLNPCAVFNLAASVSGIFYNLDNQAMQFWLNMRLQAAPLFAAAKLGITRFLQVSTVCAYDPSLDVLREEDAYIGGTPTGYAWAKRMGEYLAAWTDSAVAVRMGNMYGEHDKFGKKAHVIPVFIQKFLSNDDEPITLTGDGSQSREFLHAEDGARGMMAALQYGANGRIYNVGTGGKTKVTIRELAEKIKALTNSDKEIVVNPAIPIIDRCRHVVADRARDELGWKYRIGLDEGLRRTIAWYRNCPERRGLEVDE